ncbi:MAG: glycosyltransferase [Pseudomonadota bacterium]
MSGALRSGALGATPASGARLGEIMLAQGALRPVGLRDALARQARSGARVGEAAVALGLASRGQVADALAVQQGVARVDPRLGSPEPDLLDPACIGAVLAYRALPWARSSGGEGLVVVTPDPAAALRQAQALRSGLGVNSATMIETALCDDREFDEALLALHPAARAERAAARTPLRLSARRFAQGPGRLIALGVFAALLAAAAAWPAAALATGFLIAVVLNMVNTGLRLAALSLPPPPAPTPPRLVRATEPELAPRFTVMVALYREPQVAASLIRALERLDYPREKLEALLAVEEDDHQTIRALKAARPPKWMRIIPTPPGRPRTKPRALNHALDFASGALVAVYDAEDRPPPDQLRRAAETFARAPARIACLQARLNFYNAETGWIPRCFALEYHSWFQVTLPALARLGVPLPLGGTSLFIRRRALDRLGAWDAHNVTEDADLGMRLARAGYRTALLDSETQEEAVRDVWSWVRQRSRWQKGYLVTWTTHMRDPVRLWRDLGAVGFLGFQALFLGAAGSSLAQPLLWAAWIWWGLAGGSAVLLWSLHLGQAAMLATALLALRRADRGRAQKRRLALWALTLPAYWPMSTASSFKAVAEAAAAPTWWDKTRHGGGGAAARRGLWRRGSSASKPKRAPAGAAPDNHEAVTPCPQVDGAR